MLTPRQTRTNPNEDMSNLKQWISYNCALCDMFKAIFIRDLYTNKFKSKLSTLLSYQRIRWQNNISNARLLEMTRLNNISCEIRRRRWTWLGHMLRREGTDDSKTALGWQPEGKRARGRPKTTWRRTVEKELRHTDGWTSWNVARVVARDGKKWNDSVAALCAFWRGKN